MELVLIKPTGNQNSLILKFQNHQNHLNLTNHFFFSTTTTAALSGSASTCRRFLHAPLSQGNTEMDQ